MRAAKFEVKLWQERYAQDGRRFEPDPGRRMVGCKIVAELARLIAVSIQGLDCGSLLCTSLQPQSGRW
jgi:hypothetical protein